jgi:hypothetical protein
MNELLTTHNTRKMGKPKPPGHLARIGSANTSKSFHLKLPADGDILLNKYIADPTNFYRDLRVSGPYRMKWYERNSLPYG